MANLIDSAQLKKMLSDGDELALIDVREQGVFGQGHLLLASCIPLSYLEMRIADLVPRRTTRIVLVDGGNGENLAVTAVTRLADWGYNDLSVLDGGVAAWAAAGEEVFSGVNVPSKAFGEFVEHAYDTPRVTAADLKARRESGEKIVVLDSRPYGEFHRMSIPGGIDAPGAELVYRAYDMAPDPDTPIVVNCAGRTRSIIGAQSLINAGFPNPIAALENGTMGWHLAGFEVARGATEVADLPSEPGFEFARTAAERVASRFGVQNISGESLEALRGEPDRNLFVLDVRSPSEFALGHLPGSRNAPGGQLIQGTDEYIGVRNARIVLVDDTEVRAVMTASWLIQMGWSDVSVLDGGISGMELTSEPHQAQILGTPSQNTVTPEELGTLIDTQSAVVVDLDTSLAHRDGHIPGAFWAVRSRLPDQIESLPDSPNIVVTSNDGLLAAFAVRDIETLRAGSNVAALSGGTNAWRAKEFAIETGMANLLGPTDDVQYKPYDHAGGVEEAMNAYLTWEVALVEQLERDGSLTFPRYD